MNTREILETLVSFDTTSRDSNLELIQWVAGYLERHGVDAQLIIDEATDKANLWATMGPGGDGVILSAHTDCVPVDDQPWSTDPFQVVERAGRLYGRGTADMKGFLAAALAAVPAFQSASLRSPIHLALTHDEETGGEGIRALVDWARATNTTARWCVVGEPTSMRVVTAHKGVYTYLARFRGVEAHSSLAPRAVNAVEYGAHLVLFTQELGRQRAREGPFADGYDVGHTTVQAGVIHGGTALNIVPGACRVELEFRHLPEDDRQVLHDLLTEEVSRLDGEMRMLHPEAGAMLEERDGLLALDTAADATVVEEVRALSGGMATGKVAYGTEAGLFSDELGIPTVVCGPGSIEQAHRADEYLALSEIVRCDAFMERLVLRLSERPA